MSALRTGCYAVAGGLACVGAVALAPVAALGLGAAGVLTFAGGMGGGVIGAVGGGIYGARSDPQMAAAEMMQKARDEADADWLVKFSRYRAAYEARLADTNAQDRQNDLMLSMFSVAMAALVQSAANTERNTSSVKLYVFGAANRTLPQTMLDGISEIEASPPDLVAAYQHAIMLAADCMDVLDDLVQITTGICDANGTYGALALWTQLRSM